MTALFQLCLLLGAVVLALQILLNLVGMGASGLDLDAGDVDVELDAPDVELELDAGEGDLHAATGTDALNLLSVRAISAGTAMYGATGLALQTVLPAWLSAVLSVIPGFLAAVATAWLMRKVLGMETSGTLRLAGAIGSSATVYLTVPGASSESPQYGLVHVNLQGRTAELRAVTRQPEALASGDEVVVVSVDEETETVEVVPPSTFEDMLHDDA